MTSHCNAAYPIRAILMTYDLHACHMMTAATKRVPNSAKVDNGSQPRAAYSRVLHITGLHIAGFAYSSKHREKIGNQPRAAYSRVLHIAGLHITGFDCSAKRLQYFEAIEILNDHHSSQRKVS